MCFRGVKLWYNLRVDCQHVAAFQESGPAGKRPVRGALLPSLHIAVAHQRQFSTVALAASTKVVSILSYHELMFADFIAALFSYPVRNKYINNDKYSRWSPQEAENTESSIWTMYIWAPVQCWTAGVIFIGICTCWRCQWRVREEYPHSDIGVMMVCHESWSDMRAVHLYIHPWGVTLWLSTVFQNSCCAMMWLNPS
jgi:hypothetical protein